MRLLETILVPVDFSDSTTDILHSAAAIALTFHSEIILQSVLRSFAERSGPGEKLLDMARAGVSARLQECRKTIESQGAIVRDALVDQGVAADEIIGRAEEHDVNVVMLGAASCPDRSPHGRGTTIDEELTDIETHYSRGRELLDQGFPEEARRQLEHCVNTNDMFVPAWKALAEAYDRLGKEDGKKESLATADRIQETLSWRMLKPRSARNIPCSESERLIPSARSQEGIYRKAATCSQRIIGGLNHELPEDDSVGHGLRSSV